MFADPVLLKQLDENTDNIGSLVVHAVGPVV